MIGLTTLPRHRKKKRCGIAVNNDWVDNTPKAPEEEAMWYSHQQWLGWQHSQGTGRRSDVVLPSTMIVLSTQSLLMAMLHSLIARLRFGLQTQWWPLRKTLTSGLGLDDMSLAWPAAVQLLVFSYTGMRWGWPWVLVFVCCGWFDFCVFALMRWLGRGPLCGSGFCVFLC